MDTQALHCPNCGATLRARPGDSLVVCDYCQSSVQVAPAGAPADASTPPLSPATIAEIERLLRAGQRITAIKLYRQHTEASLKQAKDAIDAIAAGMGLPAPAAESGWSCVVWIIALVAGLALWAAAMLLVIVGVGAGARLVLGDTGTEGWVMLLQIGAGFLWALASIAAFIVWGNR